MSKPKLPKVRTCPHCGQAYFPPPGANVPPSDEQIIEYAEELGREAARRSSTATQPPAGRGGEEQAG